MQEIINAALRWQRFAVLAAAVVGVFWGAVAEVARAQGGGSAVLLALLPVVLFVTSAVAYHRLPFGTDGLRLDERRRSFFAPPRTWVAFPPMFVGFLAYQSVDRGLQAAGEVLPAAFAGFCALVGAAFAFGLWRRVPSLELTPDGLVIRRMERQIDVPWAALDPAGPARSRWVREILWLPLHRPELVRRKGWGPLAISLREVDVAPELLTAAIRGYTAHPERRAAIGTPEEYAWLHRALGGAD